MLLDTSRAWALALGPRLLASALRLFLQSLGSNGCRILYSRATLEEINIHQELDTTEKRAITETLTSIAEPTGPPPGELRKKLGRYDRWVKKLGPYDVMIALAAEENKAVLATGDWGQARFYMDLVGRKQPQVIYIPLRHLR